MHSDEYRRGVKEFYEYINTVEIKNLDAIPDKVALELWSDFWDKAKAKRDEIVDDK